MRNPLRFDVGRVLAVAAVVMGLGCWAAQASADDIYWTSDGGTIGRATLDGKNVSSTFLVGKGQTWGIAVTATHIYWVNGFGTGVETFTIGRANLDGSDAKQSFIKGLNQGDGIAVSGTHIYWTNAPNLLDAGTIGRANLDGSGVNQNFITGLTQPNQIVVNGGHIYWTEWAGGVIGRAKVDGTGVNRSFIVGLLHAQGLAVAGGHLYWNTVSNFGPSPIGRAKLDGMSANKRFITVTNAPGGLAVGGVSCLYCTPVKTTVPPPVVPPSGSKPSNTARPVISGGMQEGSTLTADKGTWSGSTPITYQFQWRICSSPGGGCTDILGQTSQTDVVTADDVGNTLDVLVTARNTAGSRSALSATSAKIGAAPSTAAGTAVTVTTEGLAPFTFTLSTATQPKIVSDTPAKAELDVPPGTVTFTVSNPYSNILSHTFEVCTTPLAKPVTTLPGVQALPNSCTGEVTPLLAPGGAIATLTVDFTTPGAYEYLGTANNPRGDASSGMKGVLNVT